MDQLKTKRLPPPDGGPRHKRKYTGTKFVEHWRVGQTISKWYFLSRNKRRVYLKVGWNLFGRRFHNHIEILDPEMRACEFYLFIEDEDIPPVAYDVNGNCILDGICMNQAPMMLYHESVANILAGSRVVIIKFCNSEIHSAS